MKKLFTVLYFLAVLSFMNAADFTGVKIYINPGHGGFDGANDRNVVTIPFSLGDTLGFWESASNLTKGLELRNLLQAKGATVIMSRTQNRDEDDRLLSEIAEEANANGVDAFLSIHSNALGVNTGTNYLLLLYHGYDNQPTVAASLPMCQKAWPRLIDNKLTVWTAYSISSNYRGDFSFYGNTSGLGVLRPLTVPGFLSEGSFHDYGPETHRLLNKDYRKLESYRFLQYFCDYFTRDLPTTGIIAGRIKGKDQRINDPKYNYKVGTDDEWKPLNDSKIKLMTENGDSINGYTTDTLYNGIFVFKDLAPGNYKLRITAQDHNVKDTTISVLAATISYMKVMMYNPNLPVYKEIPPDYPNPVQDPGVIPMSNYNFQKTNQSNPDWLSPTTSIRKVLYRNEKLYVLSEDTVARTPKISIVNAITLEKTSEMDLTGISGGAKLLSDINFTADGILLACNKDTISLPENKGRFFRMYYWESDNVAPKLLFETQSQANWLNGVVGETFAVTGSRWKCSIYTTSVTTGSSKQVRIIGYKYEDNVKLGYRYMANASEYSEALWGKKIKFTISPNGTDKIIVDGEKILPTEYKFDWSAPDKSPLILNSVFAEKNGYTIQKVATGINFFRHATHTYMVAPNCDTDNSKVGIVLFDVNEGLDKAKKVSEFLPKDGLGITPAPYMTGATKVTGYDIELLALAEKQGIARFKTFAPLNKTNVYASELKTTLNNGIYTLQFTLNDNIESGAISIFNGSNVVKTIVLGELNKGENSVNISASELLEGNYNWSVSVSAGAIDRPMKSSNDALPQMQFYSPRGVALDNNFESPYFGRVYVTEMAGGIPSGTTRTTKDGVYILNSALEDITNQGNNSYAGGIVWHASNSPMRLNVAPDGKVYVTDWSNTHPGIWIMDPANPSNTFKPVFSTDTILSKTTGLVSNKTTNIPIHGPISHCYITGTGTETKLFTFDKSYVNSVATSTGNILQYNIGDLTSLPWNSEPSAVTYNDALNGNIQLNFNSYIAPDGRGGWWISQYRATDAVGVPSLVHVNAIGVVDFNSGKTPTLIENSYTGGMAVNHEANLIAMGCKDELKIFEIVYAPNGVPSLTKLYSIKPLLGTNTNGVAFDRAGNVYAVSNNNERLAMWALPKTENTFTTTAPIDQILSGILTGFKQIKTEEEVIVYPNPVFNTAIIKSVGTSLKLVSLYDLNGKILKEQVIQGLQADINMSNLAAGIYILKIKTAHKTINMRIVKK